MPPNPLSLKIPALLMRMVTLPKVSRAVLITAGPSVTEELFTTALPTPPTSFRVVRMWGLSEALKHKQEAINAHLH